MGLDPLRRFFAPVVRWCLHRYWYFTRGMTLGARAMVFDGEGRVFLVKHSYVPGWHMPGGGVEKGETLLTALERELREEGNIEVSEPPVLHAVYFNKRISRRDHVALYIVRQFRQIAPPRAELRNHRPRLLRTRRIAGRHLARDARAHFRSA